MVPKLQAMSKSLAFGIAITSDPEQSLKRLGALCASLSESSGRSVAPGGLWRYEALVEALSTGKLDLAWLPPLLALRATGKRLASPIALPVRHGVSTYSSALFTRADSPLRVTDDLRGVRAAWVDRHSCAGYLVIRALLRSRGIELDDCFGEERFLGSHDAVAAAVMSGEADVGASYVYLDPDASTGASFPQSAGWGQARAHIIACTGSIPSDVIAARVDLPDEDRLAMLEALKADAEGGGPTRTMLGAETFISPTPEHLEQLVEILSALEDDSDVPSIRPAYD